MRALVVFALFLTACVPSVRAADSPSRPFDRIVLGLRGSAAVDQGELDDHWRPARGLELDALTPFYAGHILLSTRVAENRAQASSEVPEFTSFFLGAGWLAGRTVGERVLVGASVMVGATHWVFDMDERESVRFETEIGTELGVRAMVQIGNNWHALAATAWQATFTREQIESVFVSFGVGRTFAAPSWLRRVFE